jgi:phospholipid/cholesterol/gamma-HCH transport system substrate-binding protein
MKISNETKVGVIAACAITILILGFNFLKGETLFSKNNTYYAVYDKVDGLFRSNPVVFHGVTVGSVSSVEMDYASRQVVVSVNVPKDLQIPRNSILKITNNDLLGSKAIEIIFPPDSLALPQFAASGDTLESKKDAGMAQALTSVLSPLSESISHVLGNVDTAIANISLKSTLQDLSEALASFKNTASKLNTILDGKDEQLTSILGNIDGMTKDLKATTPKITSMVSSLDETSKNAAALDLQSLTTELTGTISEMNKTLSAIQAGEGSLGKLATNDDLWNNLNRSTHDIDSLIKDIIKYPRRYTGITEKQRKKGDEQKEVEEGIQLPDGKD